MRIALVTAVILGVSAGAAVAQESVLDRRITADSPGEAIVWLPDGIASGMFAWRIADTAGVPLVYEASPLDYRDPTVIPHRVDLAGLTVREALDILVASNPHYLWEERGGVVIIRPSGLSTDPDDTLNHRIAGVRGERLRLEGVLGRVTATIVGSRPSAKMPAGSTTQDFALDVSSGTVLDVLIAAARAHGAVMWSLPDTARGADEGGFSLGFRTFAAAGDRMPAAR